MTQSELVPPVHYLQSLWQAVQFDPLSKNPTLQIVQYDPTHVMQLGSHELRFL